MTTKESRIAVDSCVFVNIFTGGANDDPTWLEKSTAVLSAARAGDFLLTLSTVVIAEVCGQPKIRGSQLASKERYDRVSKARSFFQNAGFLTVELDERTAHKAADLAVKHQLRGADAAIVASALTASADTLYTWDADLLKLDGLLGIKVKQPEVFQRGTQTQLNFTQSTSAV